MDDMNGQKTVDLTKGNVWKTLLLYSLPLLGSAMIQQAYSLADLLIVGNFAADGQTALTSVGEASTMVNILLAFALGCNGGCSVTVAKFFGAKNNLKVRETVNTALITFAVLCAAVMALGFGLARPSMYILDITNPIIIKDSLSYLYIYLGSLPFVFLYNIGCGICSALGDSKMPFVFLVFSSVLNVGLDFLFVCAFHWDVAGAAWATFISQAAATMLTVFVLIRKLKAVKSEEKPARFDKRICKDLIITSVPIILQNSFVSVGNFFVVKRINLISEDAAAGFTTGFKLVQIANVGVGTMTNGLANFCSQNKAAGEYKRIRQGYLAVLTYAMATSLLFLLLCEVIPKPLTMLFISKDSVTEEAVNCSVLFLRIVAAFLPTVCIKIVSDGAVRGCGGNLGFTISTFTDLILRVAFVYILVGSLGFSGVCWAWSIGWSVSMCIAIGFYLAIPCLRRRKTEAENT
ncbi:MAG: polysaccharide biosynthesis C-terminal domain-containing protein [Clostridia bacterium]|nr:polysaccharide biosynthesis C-terminal domain-containing protein [Clostridia bacterium]